MVIFQSYSPIKVFSKSTAHTVQRDRIGTTVGKGQAKSGYPQDVPIGVVISLGRWTNQKRKYEKKKDQIIIIAWKLFLETTRDFGAKRCEERNSTNFHETKPLLLNSH